MCRLCKNGGLSRRFCVRCLCLERALITVPEASVCLSDRVCGVLESLRYVKFATSGAVVAEPAGALR